MPDSDVYIRGEFLDEKALSRATFTENKDHARVKDDGQVAVVHLTRIAAMSNASLPVAVAQ